MRYALVAQALALVVGLAVGLLRSSGAMQESELALRDAACRARYGLQGPRPHPDIALVTIDAKSLAELKLPMALWRPQMVQVLRNLVAGGAEVVAPDVLYELSPEALTAPEQQALGASLAAAERDLAGILLKDPVLLGAHAGPDGLNLPRPNLRAAAFDRLALLNLSEDSDGAVRRYPLYTAQRSPQPEWYPSLAVRAAELTSPPGTFAREAVQKLPAAGPDHLFLNYAGPAGTFARYSFVDVLGGQPVKEHLVLLGNYDKRLGDYYRTPFSRRGEPDMPGVEIHANALNTLRGGQYLAAAPSWLNLLAIMFLSWLTGLLAWSRPPYLVLAGGVAVLVGWTLLALTLFVTRGLWVELLGPWVAVPLACLSVYALRAGTVERERAQLVSTFGRMVSRHVMEAVLEDPAGLEQRTEREVTVLFTDINNFTPTCEASTPAQVLDMLSDYFTAMVAVILRHDGYIKQYVGDEIMIIFGAPHRQEDHAVRAVRCGLEMQEVLRQNATSGRPGFYDIKLGINTGPVILGKVGSEERWEYAAVGDDVNLGSRIMGLTKKLGFDLLVSEATRARAEASLPEVEWVPYGEQEFKGKSRKVAVFGARRKGAS